MLIIGITGNSGSGKTLVCKTLKELGAQILNADDIYNELLNMPDSPLLNQIICAFGSEYARTDGRLNRRLLGDLVFSQSDKLDLLNRITHPCIVKEIQARITDMAAEKTQVVFVEAALLFESKMDKFMDAVWVIDAPYDTKLERIIARDGITRGEADKRLRAQSDPLMMREKASLYIVNDGNVEELKAQIEQALRNVIKENQL